MKVWTTKEFIKLLERNGFEFARNKGDHHIYKRNGRIIVINDNINRMVAQRLIKEYGLK